MSIVRSIASRIGDTERAGESKDDDQAENVQLSALPVAPWSTPSRYTTVAEMRVGTVLYGQPSRPCSLSPRVGHGFVVIQTFRKDKPYDCEAPRSQHCPPTVSLMPKIFAETFSVSR